MHSLILVREVDQQMSSSGCCGRIEGDLAQWDRDGCVFPERRGLMLRMGEVYRAVRQAFGDDVEITMVDPRNFISLLPLVLRDAVRHHVPIRTALRSIAASTLTTGIFDGQVIFSGRIPPPEEVVETISGLLSVDRVGSA